MENDNELDHRYSYLQTPHSYTISLAILVPKNLDLDSFYITKISKDRT